MHRRISHVCWIAGLLALLASSADAGGAWVPGRGEGDLNVGYSVKTADSSWTARGDEVDNASWHIFRYLYSGGEAGLGKGFSFRYLVLYLDGLEGRRGDMEHNAGLSEAYLGLKYQVQDGAWPMAVAFTHRSSYLYDLPGQYDRHVFTEGQGDQAVFKGVSPEWRGLLGEDYGLTFLVSRSIRDGGWMNFEAGYNYRTTNLGDEIPVYFDIGYPIPWQELKLKGSFRWVQSVGNNTEERIPTDRFGCSANNCFPDASMMAVGLGFFKDFGAENRWYAEAGYNQWVWGRSARQYGEPYFTFGRRF